jgi:hypothetical protein
MNPYIWLNDEVKNKYDSSPYRIPLRNKQGVVMNYALVDQDKFEMVNKYKWCRNRGGSIANIDGKLILMHHFVYKRITFPRVIDHINQDPLDNRICNLRETDRKTNSHNRKKWRKSTTSKYKGVSCYKNTKKYVASCCGIHLGYFISEKEAAKCYDIYSFQIFGKMANNNSMISYEEALQENLNLGIKRKYELPKHISFRTRKSPYRVVRKLNNIVVWYSNHENLKDAMTTLYIVNVAINYNLVLKQLLHKFSPIMRNEDDVSFIKATNCDIKILVSDEDWHFLVRYKWYINSEGYVTTDKLGRMHRWLLQPKPHEIINHKNSIRFDNRRNNLEIATFTENSHQKIKKKDTTSKYFGVSFKKNKNKWYACISKEGKQFNLGSYENENDAALAYNKKALEIYGNKANLNDIHLD